MTLSIMGGGAQEFPAEIRHLFAHKPKDREMRVNKVLKNEKILEAYVNWAGKHRSLIHRNHEIEEMNHFVVDYIHAHATEKDVKRICSAYGSVIADLENGEEGVASVKGVEEAELPLDEIIGTSSKRLSQSRLSRLIPEPLKAKDAKGAPEMWEEVDEKELDEIIALLSSGACESIETRDGQYVTKIRFNSEFEHDLYKHSYDLKKAKIIAEAFDACLVGSKLNQVDVNNLKEVLVKHIDFIGVNNGNIRKIIRGHEDLLSMIKNKEKMEAIDRFLSEVSAKMDKMLNEIPPKLKENQIAILTTSSGGAHISLSKVLDKSLNEAKEGVLERDEEGGKRAAVVNESDLYRDDALYKCIGISRADVFNKVSQQSGKMDYGKKLKRLDDLLNMYIPNNKPDQMRAELGHASLVVSVSHHPEEVTAIAERAKRVCFQVCDYGELPDKFDEIVETVTKYGLDGIVFCAPSSRSVFTQIPGVSLQPGTIEGLRKKEDVRVVLPTQSAVGLDENVASGDMEVDSAASKSGSDLLDGSFLGSFKKNIDDKKKAAQEKYQKEYQHFVRTHRYPVSKNYLMEKRALESQMSDLRKELGIREGARLWTMTMGSQGIGGLLYHYIDDVIDGVFNDLKEGKQVAPLDVAILCGRNTALVDKLTSYAKEKIEKRNKELQQLQQNQKTKKIDIGNILVFKPLGFIEPEKCAILCKASEAFLSKPGGGTSAEMLLGEVPMYIHEDKKHKWERGNIEELKFKGNRVVSGEHSTGFYRTVMDDPVEIVSEKDEETRCVDYTVNVMWNIEQARRKLEPQLSKIYEKRR